MKSSTMKHSYIVNVKSSILLLIFDAPLFFINEMLLKNRKPLLKHFFFEQGSYIFILAIDEYKIK